MIKHVFAYAASFLVGAAVALFLKKKVDKSQHGKIIVLNGPSAAGKSSIQKAIQKSFDQPYLALGIDSLFNDPLPDEHGSLGTRPEGKFKTSDLRYVTTEEINKKTTVRLHIGNDGKKVVQGMHQAIRAYAKTGNNIVVDYINYGPEWIEKLKKELSGLDVTWVKVHLPLEILEEREFARSTSPVGHSRSHYLDVHKHSIEYDLEVDTSLLSPEESAARIKNVMKL